MSYLLDEPVRDVTVNLSTPTPGPTEPSAYRHARTRQDISRVSREELEDRFLRLHEETLQLKQHVHKQDDKSEKLGTKLVKDRGRMEQLAAGAVPPPSRLRNVEMEEMMEELQEKVRNLQAENEDLKQRLLVAKQQLINSQSHRPTAYNHIQPRVNSGLKKLRDNTTSPSLARPKSMRSLEGGSRPPTGQLPCHGHSLLEDARAEIRNLENVIESQRSHMEELEGASELLREELRRKEAEYEERLGQVRQEQTSKLRSHVSSNVTLIKQQKQLADRSNAVTELEGRFLQLQQTRKSQQSGDMGFLEEEASGGTGSSIRELRAAHAETIQELEKVRVLLSTESKISKGYKEELEAALQKMDADKLEYEKKLESQAQLLDTRATKIRKLEAQLRDITYGAKTYAFKLDGTAEDGVDEFNESLYLERGENLLELQIVGVTLSSSALRTLGDVELSTFCMYSFYLFDLHSTPVVTGHSPKYGFTSRYVVSMDDHFLDYLHRGSVPLKLHQAFGLDWRMLASGELHLQQLLEQDGKFHGIVPLVGLQDEARSFGSVEFWLRLRIPMTETLRLHREKMKAVSLVSAVTSQRPPTITKPLPPSSSSSWNELGITVRRCSSLESPGSRQPSPYIVYKFFHFPIHFTATVHNCQDPEFNDLRSYSIRVDVDLDQYLRSEVLQFYVFDYKGEQMNMCLGKARVPLRALTYDESLTGVFALTDPSGLPVGLIEVTLRWKFSYVCPPPGSTEATKEPKLTPEEQRLEEMSEVKLQQDSEEAERNDSQLREEDLHHLAASKAPLPKPRRKPEVKNTAVMKRVTFVETTATDHQIS